MPTEISQKILAYFNEMESLITNEKDHSAVLRGSSIIVKYQGAILENIKLLEDGNIQHKGMTFSTYGEWLYWYEI